MNFFKTFTALPFGSGRKNSRSFPNGIAKVHLFFELTNYFVTFLQIFFRKNTNYLLFNAIRAWSSQVRIRSL